MATTSRNLRAVKADEKPARKKPTTVLSAAQEGSRIDELRAMRVVIARRLDDPNTPARDLAALSRRQLEIGREIEAIVISEDEDHSVVANSADEAWDGTGF
jgi:hypothetical protein